MELTSVIFRFLKAIILGVVMAFSMRLLGFSNATSITFALIPTVLGALSVMTVFAYSVTALVFIIAIISTLFTGEDSEKVNGFTKNLKEKALSLFEEAGKRKRAGEKQAEDKKAEDKKAEDKKAEDKKAEDKKAP